MYSERSHVICFLCQQSATLQQINRSSYRYVHRVTDECGTHEISQAAIGALQGEVALRQRLSVAAAEAQRDGKILRIGVDAFGQLQAYAAAIAGVQ